MYAENTPRANFCRLLVQKYMSPDPESKSLQQLTGIKVDRKKDAEVINRVMWTVAQYAANKSLKNVTGKPLHLWIAQNEVVSKSLELLVTQVFDLFLALARSRK